MSLKSITNPVLKIEKNKNKIFKASEDEEKIRHIKEAPLSFSSCDIFTPSCRSESIFVHLK
jgi:hypothetical protein